METPLASIFAEVDNRKWTRKMDQENSVVSIKITNSQISIELIFNKLSYLNTSGPCKGHPQWTVRFLNCQNLFYVPDLANDRLLFHNILLVEWSSTLYPRVWAKSTEAKTFYICLKVHPLWWLIILFGWRPNIGSILSVNGSALSRFSKMIILINGLESTSLQIVSENYGVMTHELSLELGELVLCHYHYREPLLFILKEFKVWYESHYLLIKIICRSSNFCKHS